MVNFNALENISDFVLNTSLVDNSTEVINNIVSNTDSASGGWYGLTIMIVTYVFLTWVLTKDDEVFRLDFVRASAGSSFFALGLGILLIVLGITGNYRHVMWMALVFLAMNIAIWNLKKKSL